MEEPGQTLTSGPVWTIENELQAQKSIMTDVLYAIYLTPKKTKSDLAKSEASYIAALACQDLISTQIEKEAYGDVWRVTAKGLQWLKQEERL